MRFYGNELSHFPPKCLISLAGSIPPLGTTMKSSTLQRFRRSNETPFGTNLVRKPQGPIRWSILVLRAKAVWLGDVEAVSEAEAIAKGAEEFKQPKERLMAVRRG